MLRHLCGVLQQLKLQEHDKAMFRSALTLAFFGCLRVSEFTYSRHTQEANPQFGDISVSRTSLVYHLRRSKTDQFGIGAYIMISSSRDKVICPCRAMLAYLAQLRKPLASAPLYQWYDGSPLKRQRFVTLLKLALQQCGYDPRCYNSHSLRMGAATLAAKQGFSEDAIKRLGRWKSSAYRHYVKL